MKSPQTSLNLTSLTDIVTNSIGMLVLFSLITLLQVGTRTYGVRIPVERAADLAPVFFYCRDDKIVYLDTEVIFPNALKQLASDGIKGQRFPLSYMGFEGQTESDLAFLIRPSATAGWDGFDALGREGTAVRLAIDRLDPTKHFAYFFVDSEHLSRSGESSGFAVFRKARDLLRRRGVRSGWAPVDEQHPAHICDWSGIRACVISPSDL